MKFSAGCLPHPLPKAGTELVSTCELRALRSGAAALFLASAAAGFLNPSPAAGQMMVGPNFQVSVADIQENEPDIAAWGDRLVAVWWRDESTSAVAWAYSLDGGQTWLQGGGLPSSGTADRAFARGSICATNSGEFYCAAVVGLYGEVGVYRGSFVGSSFAWSTPVAATPPGSEGRPLLPDVPRIECDPERGYLYLTYTHARILSDDSAPHTINFVRSLDQGATWSAPVALSSDKCNGSQAVVGPDGELYVVWEDFGTRRIVGRKSVDFGASFGAPFVVASIQDNLGIEPPGWRRSVSRENPEYPDGLCEGPGFPAVAIDRTAGPHRGSLYVVWPEYGDGAPGLYRASVNESEPNSWFSQATPVEIGQDVYGSMLGGDQDCLTFEATRGTTLWIGGGGGDYQPLRVSSPVDGPQHLLRSGYVRHAYHVRDTTRGRSGAPGDLHRP